MRRAYLALFLLAAAGAYALAALPRSSNLAQKSYEMNET
jgi:hypothetical protein